jgi:alpha-beta hydrolase superfamily lysophospholipase
MAQAASTSTLSTFTAQDGDNLAVQDWPLPEGLVLRGVVVIVHGLGEHAGRYEALARQLNEWGFAVRGYDHYGHGESGGARGAIPTSTRLVDDLDDLLDTTRLRVPPGVPLILFGHSLGGLVAACHVAMQAPMVDGLVLSSPAFDPGLSAFQKFMLSVLPRAASGLRLRNGLDPQGLSHDPEVVRDYLADPLVHDRISVRLAKFIAEAAPRVVAKAPRWKLPTLLLYAGNDSLVDPRGSRAFAAAAPSDVVTAHCFGDYYHEIFNEADTAPVYAALKQWLDARF